MHNEHCSLSVDHDVFLIAQHDCQIFRQYVGGIAQIEAIFFGLVGVEVALAATEIEGVAVGQLGYLRDVHSTLRYCLPVTKGQQQNSQNTTNSSYKNLFSIRHYSLTFLSNGRRVTPLIEAKFSPNSHTSGSQFSNITNPSTSLASE